MNPFHVATSTVACINPRLEPCGSFIAADSTQTTSPRESRDRAAQHWEFKVRLKGMHPEGSRQDWIHDLIYSSGSKSCSSAFLGVHAMSIFKLAFNAAIGLLILGITNRCRFRSDYWRWRSETAFGNRTHKRPHIWTRFHAIVRFASWSWQMRRL